MKKMTSLFAALTAALCVPALGFAAADLSAVACAPGTEISVEALPPLVAGNTRPPQGVAGAGIVVDARAVRVFGGCNFPEKGPADGGKKVYYDAIWSLDLGNPVAWERAPEKLPCPAAYGADGVGGENADGKLSAIFPDGNGSFPVKIDNAAGTSRSFVAGGNVDGVPSNRAFLRAADGAWEALPDFPGTPRVQPVAGTLETPRGEAFALVGGFHFDAEKKRATLDRAGFVYFPRGARKPAAGLSAARSRVVSLQRGRAAAFVRRGREGEVGKARERSRDGARGRVRRGRRGAARSRGNGT